MIRYYVIIGLCRLLILLSPVVAVAQGTQEMHFLNSSVEWEILPLGKINPILPSAEFERFKKEVLSDDDLKSLLEDPERYVFAYVADLIRIGRHGPHQSFNMFESMDTIRATYGKLDVSITFEFRDNELRKVVKYAEEGLLCRYAEADRSRWGLDKKKLAGPERPKIDVKWDELVRYCRRDNPASVPLLSAQDIDTKGISIGNQYPFLSLSDEKMREVVAYFVENPLEAIESEQLLVPFHVAMTLDLFPWHQQCRAEADGGTVFFNGLTIKVVIQRVDGEWTKNVSFPRLDVEAPLIRHRWRMVFEQLMADPNVKRNICCEN